MGQILGLKGENEYKGQQERRHGHWLELWEEGFLKPLVTVCLEEHCSCEPSGCQGNDDEDQH